MAHRGTEAPMDFQYDQPRVPADPNSPFTRFTALKRTHSDLRSPIPNPPALAPPNSERFLFSKSSYPSTPTPHFRKVSTTTPRSSALDMSDFTDPDIFIPATTTTPAPRLTFRGGGGGSGGGAAGYHSPPRGRYHDGAITKLKRRPRSTSIKHTPRLPRDLDLDWDSDSTTAAAAAAARRHHRPAENWADSHRDVPLIISQYVQLFFNTALVLLFLYALLSAYVTVRRDVSEKLSQHSADLVAAANSCAHEFLVNRCAPGIRVPALQKACAGWERCMNRDHTQVGKAKLSAQTFAEIVESFVEPVSYRTMAFAVVVGCCALFVPNFALGLYRARAVGHPAPVLAAAAPPIAERLEYRAERERERERDVMVGTPGRRGETPGGRRRGMLL
ncbi:Di-sulfide bridge nucleocytoplasmic transport domain-containing protein [Morchella snyderi]|nr:Di-sulfide bridge nucleocytoplasmic transport domain-containing protein [Morchella snyderi]